MCEAGLHITLGVGLRLFNLLEHDLQQWNLQLLVQKSTDTPVGLAALLKDAQLCETEAEDALQPVSIAAVVIDDLTAVATDVLIGSDATAKSGGLQLQYDTEGRLASVHFGSVLPSPAEPVATAVADEDCNPSWNVPVKCHANP